MQSHWWMPIVTSLLGGGAVSAIVSLRESARLRRESDKLRHEFEAVITQAAEKIVTAMGKVNDELRSELRDRTSQLDRLKAQIRVLEGERRRDQADLERMRRLLAAR